MRELICPECGNVTQFNYNDWVGCMPCYNQGHLYWMIEDVELKQRIERNKVPYPLYAKKLQSNLDNYYKGKNL